MRLDYRLVWYLSIAATLAVILVFPISVAAHTYSSNPVSLISNDWRGCVTTAILQYDSKSLSLRLDAIETRHHDTCALANSLAFTDVTHKNKSEVLTTYDSAFQTIAPDAGL